MEDWFLDLSLFINILGFGQGVFLLITLLKVKKIRSANYYLIFLTFCFSLIILNAIYRLSDYRIRLSLFDVFSNTFTLAVGPSLYLFLKTKLSNKLPLKESIFHYVPFIGILLYDSISFLFSPSTDLFYNGYLLPIGLIIYIISYPVYLILSFHLLNQNNSYLLSVKWMKSSILVMMVPWISVILILLLENFFEYSVSNFFKFNSSLFFAICTFYFSLIHSSGDIGFAKKDKYEGSKIGTNNLVSNLNLIKEVLEDEELFLDKNLSLMEVSRATNISVRDVSLTINQATNQSFNDFINSYRINYFKTLLKQPKSEQFTIVALAEKSGFKSGSTFYNSFKKITGLTPSQYKEKLNH